MKMVRLHLLVCLSAYMSQSVSMMRRCDYQKTNWPRCLRIHHPDLQKFAKERNIEYRVRPLEMHEFFLLHAAREGDLKRVQDLVELYDVYAGCESVHGVTPLMEACSEGQREVVSYLTKTCKVDVNARNMHGEPALFNAVACGSKTCIEMLLSAGADVNAQSHNGLSPFALALKCKNMRVIRRIFKEPQLNLNICDTRLQDYVNYAVRNNDIETLHALKKRGCTLEHKNRFGFTPLMDACRKNYLVALIYLLRSGAASNCATPTGLTPLLITAEYNSLLCMKIIVETTQCNIDEVDDKGFSALMIAAGYGYVEMVDYLLKQGARADLLAKTSATALHLAAQAGQTECVRLLLDHDPELQHQLTSDGSSPLLLACQKENRNIVRLLLKSKSMINTANDEGCTPLIIAIIAHRFEIICELIDAGVEMNKRWQYRNISMTPLMIAVNEGVHDIIRLLIMHGAVIDAIDSLGRTPLMIALAVSEWQIAKDFINRYSTEQLLMVDVNYCTAYDYAFVAKQEDIKHLIRDKLGVEASDNEGQASGIQ